MVGQGHLNTISGQWGNDMKYSAKTNTFYDLSLNHTDLPDDLIDVTDAEFQAALTAREEGGTITVVAGKLTITPPAPPTEAELLAALVAANTAQKSALLSRASRQINTLQDAVDLDMATAEEAAALIAWKKYRVLLNRVDVAGEVDWPESP